MDTDYKTFLESKIISVDRKGFEVDESRLHPQNFGHQNLAIQWALRLGSALIAMSFGLGKTRIQCEIARLIHEHTGQPFLVICPLGVKHQFQAEDGPALGMDWQYVRTDAEAAAATSPYLITNYERVRDGDITAATISELAGVSLDEGSVLRSLGSKTSQTFKALFRDVGFRYVCTATPSPNEYKELIYYAEFLGVMDHGQALTRWFKRDSSKAGHLTLHPHHERDFWMWVASWALFLFKPSDLGFSDAGYELPELQVHWHRIDVDQRRAWGQTDNRGQHRLFLDAAGGVREASAEKRETLDDRLQKLIEIMAANPGRKWLLWHHLEREREAIEAAVPEAVTVYGSQDLDTREQRILGFVRGEIPVLATKPEIAGSGCNFQRHCHSNIFLGVDYKFQDFIQAIHRTYRFQQTQPVDVHILYAESEDAVVDVLKQKWEQHNRLVEQMRAIIQRYGLSHEAMRRDLVRSIGVQRQQVQGKLFTAVNNDCVEEARSIADNRFHAIVTSIPFSNHYEYVASVNDFGHNENDNRFFDQMDYLIPELLRILKPGRVAAIHAKDLIHYGHKTESGFMEVNPFCAKTVLAFMKHGFLFEGEITITTDVVRENNSTYRLGWSEMCKDGSKMGVGLPEKVLLFRKPPSNANNAYADEPVRHNKQRYTRARWQVDAHSYWRSNGNTLVYDYDEHVARLQHLENKGNLPSSFFYEPPASNSPWVWDDVNPMQCLNVEQSRRKLEGHVCPLPFDIVDRLIERFSSDPELTDEPEEIFDPFGGLGTVAYRAIHLGRRGYVVELSPVYWDAAVDYCRKAEANALAPTLFDLLKLEAGE
jgi:DNA modification methylase